MFLSSTCTLDFPFGVCNENEYFFQKSKGKCKRKWMQKVGLKINTRKTRFWEMKLISVLIIFQFHITFNSNIPVAFKEINVRNKKKNWNCFFFFCRFGAYQIIRIKQVYVRNCLKRSIKQQNLKWRKTKKKINKWNSTSKLPSSETASHVKISWNIRSIKKLLNFYYIISNFQSYDNFC
jgi:hypothetical protein